MPSLNTSSSADISFLLLTFFLLTSSITNEQGIPRLLPKISNQEKQQQEDIRERNILTILVNKNDDVLINKTQILKKEEIAAKLKDIAKAP